MTDPADRLAQATVEEAAARERLSRTAARLQVRLEPRRLAKEARQHLVGARDGAVERAGAAVRRRPGALAGVVALAGLWLGRHRVAALFRKLRGKATADADAS